ncbi:MAG: hypothetical protein R3B06_05850 [Kofleriaceae bacterium]
MRAPRATLATVGLVLAVGACGKREPQYTGIGPYRVDKLQLKDAKGRCEPTDLPDGRKGTWCFLLPDMIVAGRPASVDLYFLGVEPTAPVIEIQLQIKGCHEDELGMWLRSRFGQPSEARPTWLAWQNRKIFVVGELPTSPGRCMVRVLPAREQTEFERLRREAPGAPAPAPTP